VRETKPQKICPAGHALVKGANVEQYKKLTIEQCGGIFPGAGCNYCNSMSSMEQLPNMWSCSDGCQVDVCLACSTKFGWDAVFDWQKLQNHNTHPAVHKNEETQSLLYVETEVAAAKLGVAVDEIVSVKAKCLLCYISSHYIFFRICDVMVV
jgi:hypothetical protein